MASLTHDKNTSPDGSHADSASIIDVEEMLRLLPDTKGNVGPATDPESVERTKAKVRNLMESVPKLP